MDLDTVFKAYDIRGRTDTGELDDELFRRVGSAFASLTGAAAICVGRDCRSSSPALFEALADGMTSAGSKVVDLGEVPTDLVYFYSGSMSLPGAMITASHNPAEYNGLKLCRSGALPVGVESGLTQIKSLVESGSVAASGVPGVVETVDAVGPYVDHLLAQIDPTSLAPLSVAADGGNGMAGVAIERVFSAIECTLEGIYLEPDGSFPNHPADPLQPENLVDLIDLVITGGHDLGVAFDGDADRAFFIDDAGQPLSGSTVTALIARALLEAEPGATIVHNLITSRAVPEIVAEAGGKPVRTRVGHSYIKQVMAETDAIFGGEHSGHYYFRGNYRADSGMIAMLVLLQVLSRDGRRLSQLRQDVERYAASGEINFRVEDAASAMEEVASRYAGHDGDRLDGLTVRLGVSWFNLRPSNTEPLLRLNVEAPNAHAVAEIVAEVGAIVKGAA
jgi:phosphomannomutase